jgi:hypothetical protein
MTNSVLITNTILSIILAVAKLCDIKDFPVYQVSIFLSFALSSISLFILL